MPDYTVTDPSGKDHSVTAPVGADDGSIIGFVHNTINGIGDKIQGAWDATYPARVQVGALMSGDPQTVMDVQNQRMAGVTKQDVYDAMSGMGVDAAGGGLVGATAWHGSPHLFDKFKNEAIGTGEGAQAYGHGLYLAEHQEVAKSYQDDLGGFTVKRQLFPKPKSEWDVMDWNDYSKGETPMDVRDVNIPLGYIYKTDIPDSHIDKMLDYDLPLSQQSQYVKNALATHIDEAMKKNAAFRAENGWGDEPRGSHFVGQEDMLAQAGIPGIKYLDGSSRTAGEGTRNFVIFDPNSIKILERNGVSTGEKPWDAPTNGLAKFENAAPNEQASALEEWAKQNGVNLQRTGASEKSDSLYYVAKRPKEYDPEYGWMDYDTAHIRLSQHYNQTNTSDYLNAIKHFNIYPEGDSLTQSGSDLLDWINQGEKLPIERNGQPTGVKPWNEK